MGEPDVKREGRDATVLTIGPSLFPALAAAQQLEENYGLSLEVIDARSLVPFNYDPVITSVKKTGHLLVVTEASERGSFAMTLAANLTRFAFGSLKSAPRVLGSPNWIVPGAEMETTYFPQADDIIQIVTSEMYPEKHTNRRGVRTWNDIDLARKAL
jgi:2-oxoisovalerate dehydrogenase E1 component